MKRKPKIGLLLICSNRFRGMGEGTGATYPERQQKVADALISHISEYADVVPTGQIYEREDVKAAMNTFAKEKVDCVFASYLSWSDDFHWIRFLRDMYPIPILFAHIVPDSIDYESTWDEGNFVQFLCNGGLVGTLQGSGSVARFNRPMLMKCAGTVAECAEELRHFAKAACLRAEMKESTVGLMEYYNEVMWATYVDPYMFFAASGAELRFMSVATLEDYANRVSDERVDEYIAYLREKFTVCDDVEEEHFRASIRTSLALEDMAMDNGCCAVACNDVDKALYQHMGLRPGFCPSPAHPELTVTPEGDLGACLATHILKNLSGAHTLMLEMSYIDRKDNTVVLVHGGPNDYTDPAGKTMVARDVRFAKSGWKHAGAPFAWHCISEGEKTVVHMSQDGDTFKMVVMMAESVPEELNLCSYSQGRIRLKGDPIETVKKLMDIGVTQHYAVADGDNRKALRAYANMMGYTYYEI